MDEGRTSRIGDDVGAGGGEVGCGVTAGCGACVGVDVGVGVGTSVGAGVGVACFACTGVVEPVEPQEARTTTSMAIQKTTRTLFLSDAL